MKTCSLCNAADYGDAVQADRYIVAVASSIETCSITHESISPSNTTFGTSYGTRLLENSNESAVNIPRITNSPTIYIIDFILLPPSMREII